MITSRVVPVGAEYAVELETENLDWRFGPYPTPADAEAVRTRLVAVASWEQDNPSCNYASRADGRKGDKPTRRKPRNRLPGVTDRAGIASPAGAAGLRPVQEALL